MISTLDDIANDIVRRSELAKTIRKDNPDINEIYLNRLIDNEMIIEDYINR
jgi:hypothetical protein